MIAPLHTLEPSKDMMKKPKAKCLRFLGLARFLTFYCTYFFLFCIHPCSVASGGEILLSQELDPRQEAAGHLHCH